MKFLISFILFFTPYVNIFEWKVDRFFKSVKSNDSIFTIRYRLLGLMKANLIVVNVWMEKKYKGYNYLKKRTRRRMYRDSKKIADKFLSEIQINPSIDLKIPERFLNDEKMIFLAQIMCFLRPGKYYKYLKTASFGKLLRDPNIETLEGDCNQIVTLYAYLYSLKFSIDDLEIKLLKDHVCLHYQGVDIEATTGSFQKYNEFTHILPITEIISTNMLDLADFREEVSQISPRVFVKSAQLAVSISSLREIVDQNLQVAYNNLAVDAMKHKDFDTAFFYSSKMRDKSLFETVRYNRGLSFYQKGLFDKALKVFIELGNEKMQIACYGGMYNKLQKKVSHIKTQKQFNENRSIYKKMLELAVKMRDEKLANSLREMLKK